MAFSTTSRKQRIRLGANRTYTAKLGQSEEKPRYSERVSNVRKGRSPQNGRLPMEFSLMKEKDGSLSSSSSLYPRSSSHSSQGRRMGTGREKRQWRSSSERRRCNASLFRLPFVSMSSSSRKSSRVKKQKEISLMQKAGMPSSERRVKDGHRVQSIQRSSRKQRYGIQRRKEPKKRLSSSMRSYVHHGRRDVSLRAPLERRLGHVLWRSGLVMTRSMAHQHCRHGHVSVCFSGEQSFRPTTSLRKRKPGTIIQVHPQVYQNSIGKRSDQWSQRHRRIPSYREVDWLLGLIVVKRLPMDLEIPVPLASNRSRSTKAMRS